MCLVGGEIFFGLLEVGVFYFGRTSAISLTLGFLVRYRWFCWDGMTALFHKINRLGPLSVEREAVPSGLLEYFNF